MSDTDTESKTALYATQFSAKMLVENSGIVALSTDPLVAREQMEEYLSVNYEDAALLLFEPFEGDMKEDDLTELVERSRTVFENNKKTLN